ncbi:hypothetical protein SAMN04488573_12413, partial [Bacillus sp. 5mfcol3.1]|uniref:hypothetical protein n=1 Tax=Bacillus sp. 5mfcol3.1 TaxID=1761756 RepID=UPI0008E12E19
SSSFINSWFPNTGATVTVPSPGAAPFTTDGPSTADIVRVGDVFTINTSGIYFIWFAVTLDANNAGGFSLFLNGSQLGGNTGIVDNAGTGAHQVSGARLVALSAGDQITVQNQTTAPNTPIDLPATGTAAILQPDDVQLVMFRIA